MRSIWLSLLVVCALLSVLAAAGCGEDCPAGQQMCGSVCLNVATDHDNCGGCGNACGPTQTCQANQCTCPGGQQPCGQQCVAGVEICNNLDDNCNSQIDEGVAPQSCNNPCGAGTQTCTNGTWGACSAPTPSEEVCDTRDNDCDGQVDEGVTITFYPDGDGDHFGTTDRPQQACSAPAGHVEDNTDCDDANGAINPSATEICDGLDNNCNDAIDEGLGGACACVPPATQNCGVGDDVGVCEFGTQTCADTGSGPQWGDCVGGVRPAEEICDGLDNDCDGQTDEGMTPDTYEANNSCAMARGPLEAQESGAVLVIEGNLYSSDGSQDEDWYNVWAHEYGEWFNPLEWCVPFTNQCSYALTVTFAPPEDSTDPTQWELCMYYRDEGTCSGELLGEFCTEPADWDDASGSYEFSVIWGGTCGGDDSRTMLTVVRNAGSTLLNDCGNYHIEFEMVYADIECPAE